MATTTSITTSYVGEKAQGYIAAALLSANTIEGGGITVKPNIKKAEVLKKIAVGDLIADGSCDFDATSSVTLTERTISPSEFQVNLQFCKTPFRADWDALSMGYSAFDNLPPDFQSFLIAHVAEKTALKTENNIWQGDSDNSGEFDGLIKLAGDDADVIDVAGTTITAANVVAELGKVVDAIPAQLYGSEDLAIYIPQNVYRAYVRSLGGFGANGLGANGVNNQGNNQSFGDLMFDGVKLFVANGLPNNVMFAAEKSNLMFGTGLLADHNEVQVIDMSPLDGSQNCRVVMRFTSAVQYVYGSEIVKYE
ncbi:hypothetical protein [uncultured Mediterranean phage uvMED]|nr:hypothetical protein [uncultured Mediterranean phage uvMED]